MSTPVRRTKKKIPPAAAFVVVVATALILAWLGIELVKVARDGSNSILPVGRPWNAQDAYLQHFRNYLPDASPVCYVSKNDRFLMKLDMTMSSPNKKRIESETLLSGDEGDAPQPVSFLHDARSALLADPRDFYAAYKIGRYFQTNHQVRQAGKWFARARRLAPKVIVGRIEYDDGRPAIGVNATVFTVPTRQGADAFNCSYDVTTDYDGCYAIPVWNEEQKIGVLVTPSLFRGPRFIAVEQDEAGRAFIIPHKVGIVPAIRLRKPSPMYANGLKLSDDIYTPTILRGKRLRLAWTPMEAPRYTCELSVVSIQPNSTSEDTLDPTMGDTSDVSLTVEVDRVESPPLRSDTEYAVQVTGYDPRGTSSFADVLPFMSSPFGATKEGYFKVVDAAFPPAATPRSVQAIMPLGLTVRRVVERNGKVYVYGIGSTLPSKDAAAALGFTSFQQTGSTGFVATYDAFKAQSSHS